MGGYDENRPSLHTELEEAAKESRAKAEERFHELEANRHPDVSDAAQVRGRAQGLAASGMLVDHSVREGKDEPEDPFAAGAVVPPRHTESGEWEVNKANLGGKGSVRAEPAVVAFPAEEKKAKGSGKSES